MELDHIDRIDNIDTLRGLAKSFVLELQKQEQRIARLEAQIKDLKPDDQLQLQLEIDALKQQLANRNKVIFGTSSEKRPLDKPKQPKQPQTGHGPTEQVELEVIEKEHVLDEADLKCRSCGKPLQEWEGQSVDSEEIEVIERRFIRVKHRRKKYRCPCGGCVEVAIGPRKLIPGGRYSSDFAVHVAVNKYCDHLPLERQVRMMKRQGLDVTSQTLWDQILALSNILKSAQERMLDYIRSRPVVGADETWWRVLNKKTKRWYVWALAAEDAVAYLIEDSRSIESANSTEAELPVASRRKAGEILSDFEGTAITDGYACYSALQKRGGRFRLAHCWSHVRRKFVEIEASYSKECGEILDLIGKLYAIERQARDGPNMIELRRKLRNEESRKIIEEIHSWALQTKALGESPLRKAVDSTESELPAASR